MKNTAKTIIATTITYILSGCTMYRIFVDYPTATPATSSRPTTYWNPIKGSSPVCQVAIENQSRMIESTWSGSCKNGLAEGCGTLIHGLMRMNGCFSAGIQEGTWTTETEDWISTSIYRKDYKTGMSFIQKPGQAERDKIRKAAFDLEQERRRRRDSEELAQAVGQITTMNAKTSPRNSTTLSSVIPTQTQSTPRVSTTPTQTTQLHDPAGEANNCIRPNPGVPFGGFTNICSYPVSFIHCYSEVAKDSGDSWAFHCDRPGGLWANSTTPGNLGPGRTDSTSIPKGARISWVACRDPFSIREARFDGTSMRAICVRR